MENFADIFSDDAFSLVSLTAAINEMDHVPDRAGQLAFVGVGEGVNTETVSIERKGEKLSLIKTTPRGAPAPKGQGDGRTLRAVNVPHIAKEDTIGADQVSGVREFGSTDTLRTVESVVNSRMQKLVREHDLTIENLRLGALRGQVLDADGSLLVDLFELFGVKNSQDVVGPEVFDFDLGGLNSEVTDLRVKCQAVTRFMKRKAKMPIPSTAMVWAFCGDGFFDSLISLEDVKKVYTDTDEQRVRLGGNYAFGTFEFGGIVWENYQGTDDGETVAIAPDECRLFLTGVPGLYAEYFAPADFMETVNTLGLPRYAKVAPDQRFNQFVELHTQQNPLPLCLRPQTLIRGTA